MSRGYDVGVCPSVVPYDGDDVMDAITLMGVHKKGKCCETVGQVDAGELARQVGIEPCVCDSGVATHKMSSATRSVWLITVR